MNELDQAPASGQGSATDVIQREPAGDQHAGSYDSQARSPRAESLADTDPSYYDGDIRAALAADDTPTRQEAARQDAAGDGHASSGDDSSPDGDARIDAIVHEDDGLPDSRTRQQAAADDIAEGASPPGEACDTARVTHEDPAGTHDAGIEAILHEDDHLPDPCTRPQAAQEDATSSAAAWGKDSAATAGEQPQSVPDPSTPADAVGNDGPAADGPVADQQFTVVRIGPDARTVGDDAPTGIGLKPTGEQLIEADDNKASRAERARKEFLSKENLSDAFDATNDWAKTGQDLFSRPPAGQHVEVPTQEPVISVIPHQGIDPGSVATAGLALGILGAEFLRRGRSKMEQRRGQDRAGDR
jgi:hypothetical protein